MGILIAVSLLIPLLGGPGPDPDRDELGMAPRPTLRCGGRKRMAKWDAAREVRLNERANKAVGGWAGDLGSRLGAGEYDGRLALWRSARDRWQACRAGLRPLEATCVAVAARRPGLCAYATWGEGGARCRELVAAALVLERGGPPLDPEGGLTPEVCATGGRFLAQMPLARMNCDGLLWQEAIRTNEPGWCDTIDVENDIDGSDRRAACLAVFAASPDLCPGPGSLQNGVLLDRACRDETLDPGWTPELSGESDRVRMRFALMSVSPLHARCAATITVRGAEGERRVSTAWFDLHPAEAAETVAATPVEVILSPASLIDDFDIETTCRWSLDEPGHGKAEGVMGLIGW